LRLSYNSRQRARGLKELEPLEFFEFVTSKLDIVEMDSAFLTRDVNEGFSGGEKKRNEILQMALLDTKLSVLDETDSGLDIDALKIVARGVNSLANDSNSIILITHYQRLLDYIQPDYVHIMQNGRIVKTGTKELALELESKGYDWVMEGIG
jgi:Fe-S cluster assembly ATP-binding protein